MIPPRPALAALLLAALAGPAAAAPRLVVVFADAANDANGPGTYTPPGDSEYLDGDFDLRRFAVSLDGPDVLFEVTLGAPIRRPAVEHRTNAVPVQLWNEIYLQNVDIYLDTDRSDGSGFSQCIPGRRVAFADGRTWEKAVVLTPQPGPARAVVQEAMGKAAAHVIFAEGVRAAGRTLTARVPAVALGGVPTAGWGYSVHVSGAAWERSYDVADRLRGHREENAFTLPVLPVREAWAFGGAPEGNAHPRVVDVLLPPGADQRLVLGSWDAASGGYAKLPFVDGAAALPGRAAKEPAQETGAPKAQAPSPPRPPEGPTLTVAFVAGNLISLAGPSAGLVPMQFGEVLGPDGSAVARVVVVQVVDGGVVVNAVENRERVTAGARVRFAAPAGRR